MNQANARAELNGQPVSLQDLRALLPINYGHFTVVCVSDGCVRGLDLHLHRLQEGTRELFDSTLDCARVRAYMRHALAGDSGLQSLRVTICSRNFDRARPGNIATPDVLIQVSPVMPTPITPLRLKSFQYQRELAHIKHVGTFPLFHYRRCAQHAGFDDALFVSANQCIAEASVWNIGFWDGESIIWPDAPQLAGTGMRLLQAGLQQSGIAQTTRPVRCVELSGMRAAFVCNANVAARPVACIDELALPLDDALIAALQRCHEANSWQSL